MKRRPEPEYTWIEGLAICLGMIAVQLSTQVISQWGTYFYSPSLGTGRTVYVAVSLAGMIFIVGTIWDSITDPLIGMWSDKTRTRPGWLRVFPISGRRRPFIFWGSLFMVFTSVLYWYPPVQGESTANFVYGCVLLCLHWTVFTITVVPLTSLGPEIARSEEARVSLGIWTAVGMIVGLAMAIVLPGEMITRLDPERVESSIALNAPESGLDDGLAQAIRAILPEDMKEPTALSASLPPMPRGFEDAMRVTQSEGAVSVLFTGPLFEALDEAYHEPAVSAALPEALQGSFEFIHLPDALAVVFPDGPLDHKAETGLRAALGLALGSKALERIVIEHDAASTRFSLSDGLVRQLNAQYLGTLAQGAVPPALGEQLRITRTEGTFSAAGYQRVALIFALIAFVLYQVPVWLVRERYDSEQRKEAPVSWLRGMRDAARNYPFVVYCFSYFLFTLGFLAAQNALPYFAELGLGGDEGTVTILMIPFILTCIVFFVVVPPLTKRLHTKYMTFLAFLIITTGLPWMYVIAKSDLAPGPKMFFGALLFGYCGIAQSIIYVMMTPMLGECIDYDELRSGQRREALYNGLHGLATKMAIAFAILLSTQSMSRLGNSVENPVGVFLVGPFAALFTLLGLVAILFYPILDVARNPHKESEDGTHDTE